MDPSRNSQQAQGSWGVPQGYYPGVQPLNTPFNPNQGFKVETSPDLYFTQQEYPHIRQIEHDSALGGHSDNHPFHKRYGTFKSKPAAIERLDVMTWVALVIVPTAIFGLLVWVTGQRIRWSGEKPMEGSNPNQRPVLHTATWIWFFMLFPICIAACKPAMQTTIRGRKWQFILFSCLLAWMSSYVVGTLQYWNYFEPYYEIEDLAVYPDVSPTDSWYGAHGGNQFMDAGIINFVYGSHVDTTKSYGMKNKDVWCVAPIVFHESHLQIVAASLGKSTSDLKSATQANHTPAYNSLGYNGSGTLPPHFDFWAVGTNCCSGHGADFMCGEFDNINAHSGLRLMNDRDRGYFRLAVQEAESAYNIKAEHPIFVYFMEDPMVEVNNYINNGLRQFKLSIYIFAVWQLVFTWILANTYITGAWFAYELPAKHMQVESRRQSNHGYAGESIIFGPNWWIETAKSIWSGGNYRAPGLSTSYHSHDGDLMY